MFRFPMLLEVLVVTERVEAFRAFDLNGSEREGEASSARSEDEKEE